jgi:hypothetical protein
VFPLLFDALAPAARVRGDRAVIWQREVVMASLWTLNSSGELVEQLLDAAGRGDGLDHAARPVRVSDGLSIVPATAPGGVWVLIAGTGVRVTVNSAVLPAGIRVLDSRDEIRSGSFAAVFADERVAQVEAFPEAPRPVCCARCACAIDVGSPALRCPACGSWYHQQEPGDYPCWSAVPFCQVCGCATTTGGAAWTPEEC